MTLVLIKHIKFSIHIHSKTTTDKYNRMLEALLDISSRIVSRKQCVCEDVSMDQTVDIDPFSAKRS